jgi:benzoate membrane transport protein
VSQGDEAARADAGSLIQPVAAGLLAAVVGFASSFAIVLAGLTAVGATPAEAASGLLAVSAGMGLLNIVFSLATRTPLTIAWSTPGAALLVAVGTEPGGFPAAAGAFVVAGLLIVLAGLWRPFGRAVAAIPMPLAGAMLAGVLLELCLAPVKAAGAMPELALPIILAWALALRFARAYAVPIGVAVTAVVVMVAVRLPADAFAGAWPAPVLVLPAFNLHATIGIALPLFIVTMASQNVPGLAVMRANGYRPEVGPVFVWTGLGSVATAFFGGHTLNLAAITAALCAGPEAHADPARRWIASFTCGVAYLGLALLSGFAARFIAATPPLLVQAVAGLALLGSLGGALRQALDHEEHRLPAVVTFVTSASGIAILGVGSAFWGLVAGGALMALLSLGRPRA